MSDPEEWEKVKADFFEAWARFGEAVNWARQEMVSAFTRWWDGLSKDVQQALLEMSKEEKES
jgi:TRAP-type C4-dicarboxylate transport system substrate-binding protein